MFLLYLYNNTNYNSCQAFFVKFFMVNIFSERLKQLRLSKNLKQSDMAILFNLSTRGYQKWEAKNPIFPSAENLIILADYFNVSIDYLVGRTDNPELNK